VIAMPEIGDRHRATRDRHAPQFPIAMPRNARSRWSDLRAMPDVSMALADSHLVQSAHPGRGRNGHRTCFSAFTGQLDFRFLSLAFASLVFGKYRQIDF